MHGRRSARRSDAQVKDASHPQKRHTNPFRSVVVVDHNELDAYSRLGYGRRVLLGPDERHRKLEGRVDKDRAAGRRK